MNEFEAIDRTPLLVFADDWGRHPSSCQHLVGRLLDRHPTTWVNTIGMRTPKFDWSTVSRGLGKVRQWLRAGDSTQSVEDGVPTQSVGTRIDVVNPRMWPWFTRKFDRWLNRRLLRRQLKPLVEAMREEPVAVTTVPIVADLMPHLPVRHWVYYCVDDFSLWPGLDQRTMARMERLVVERADSIVAASEALQDRIRHMGREASLLTHGVDLGFWQTLAEPHPLVAHLPKPLVVFWGVIDRRMDVEVVTQLSAAMHEGTIVLVGPEQDPDPRFRLLPNVRFVGAVPFEHLPAIAQSAAVLVMPYADLPVTRAMQPLKLKEYLATGKPVVVRDLPATRDWKDCLDAIHQPDMFANHVLQRIAGGLPESQRVARQRLVDESWDSKARQMEQAALSLRERSAAPNLHMRIPWRSEKAAYSNWSK